MRIKLQYIPFYKVESAVGGWGLALEDGWIDGLVGLVKGGKILNRYDNCCWVLDLLEEGRRKKRLALLLAGPVGALVLFFFFFFFSVWPNRGGEGCCFL